MAPPLFFIALKQQPLRTALHSYTYLKGVVARSGTLSLPSKICVLVNKPGAMRLSWRTGAAFTSKIVEQLL